MADDVTLSERVDQLERRVAALERHLVSREVLDEEILSLERRMSELREIEGG
jgi:hypothetical protein